MPASRSIGRSGSSGPSDELLALSVGFDVRQGAKEVFSEMEKEQAKASARARAREAKADQDAKVQAKKAVEELVDRRRKLAVEAIQDETRRRRAAIEAEYNEERRRIKALLADRLRANEIAAKDYKRQLASFDRDLAAVRDRRLSEVPADTLRSRAGQMLTQGLSARAGALGGLVGSAGGTAALGGLAAAGAVATGLAKATAIASSFEDQLIAIKRTTGLTDEELDALGAGLLGLSARLGAPQEGLAAIAEQAGSLNIQGRDNILAFTETIAKFASATGLSADEAAEALGKIGAAFGIPTAELSRLGSAIDQLADSTGANVGDIVTGLREVGAAGRSAGLTADQVAALVAVLVEAGVKAPEAGNALKNVFTLLATESEKVVAVTGQTQEAFLNAFQADPLAALNMYLAKLREMSPVLQAIRIEDTFGRENIVAVSTLVQQTERIEVALADSARAFEENTRLNESYEASLDSLSAQWAIVTARLTAATTAAGQDLLPALTDLVRGLNALTADTGGAAQEIGGVTELLRTLFDVLGWVAEGLDFLRIHINGVEAAMVEGLYAALATVAGATADLLGILSRFAPGLADAERGARNVAYGLREMQGAANVDLSRVRRELDATTASARAGAAEIEAWGRAHAAALAAGGPRALLSGTGGPQFREAATPAPPRPIGALPPDEAEQRREAADQRREAATARRAERAAAAQEKRADTARRQQLDAYQAFRDQVARIDADATADSLQRDLDALAVRFDQERARVAEMKAAALKGTALTAAQRVEVEAQAAQAVMDINATEIREAQALRDEAAKKTAADAARAAAERITLARSVAEAQTNLTAREREERTSLIRDEGRRRKQQIEDTFFARVDALLLAANVEEQLVAASVETEAQKAERRRAIGLQLSADLLAAEMERVAAADAAERDAAQAEKRRHDEATERETRRAAERVAELRRYTDALVDTLVDASSVQRELSEAQVAFQRAQFGEEEKALRDSLSRREISQVEFAARMEALAQGRTDFEKELERDRAGFIERSTRGVLEVVKATLKEEGAAFASKALAELLVTGKVEVGKSAQVLAGTAIRGAAIAGETVATVANAAANIVSAIATQIKQVVAAIPFPFNLAAIPLGVAGVVGAYAAAKSVFFEGGGFVGRPGERGRDTVPIVVGRGEAILNYHQQAVVEDSLRRTGRGGLGTLFRSVTTPHSRHETGGFAGFAPLLAVPSTASRSRIEGGSTLDVSSLERRLDTLATRIDRQTDQLAREQRAAAGRIADTFASPHAARRQRRLADEQGRLTDPAGGRL